MPAYLTSRRLIVLKGLLFLMLLAAASTLILMECPSWRIAGLLALVAWSAARWSFFTTYVLQTYVDPAYRHDGPLSLLLWLLRRPR
jgi:predicted MFS family arabinose efflux permease